MKFYCNTCGLLDPKRNICQLSGLEVSPTADSCSKHHSGVYICGICKKRTIYPVYNYKKDETYQILCSDCASKLSTCHTCTQRATCPFETDSSSLPKVVQKRIQQGPMTQIIQIRNPDRVEITCKTKCSCFSEEFGCMKEIGLCEKYDEL